MGKSERDLPQRDFADPSEASDQHVVGREEPTIASDPPAPSTSATSGAAAPTVGPDGVAARDAVPKLDITPADLLVGLPPELVDHPRYCPLELLGQGGMGSVYKASHRVMDRVVALKVIRPELARPDIVERFRREIRAAARLSHPNIVTAHDAEQAGDVHFLVVEFIDGLSLDRMVARDGVMDVQQACLIVKQVAEGLQHAYEVGMVHRDIKPQNIMCTASGQVKILDFGLALVYNDASNTSALTQGGGVMGTPDYIAPEQANDAHAADTRSDIYSLGCTLYFLLRGKPPFSEGSIVQKLMAHLEKEAPSLSDFRHDVPIGLMRVIHKSMSKRPEDRYQTPLEFQRALLPYSLGTDFDDDIVTPTIVAPVFTRADDSKPPVRIQVGSHSGFSHPAQQSFATSQGDSASSATPVELAAHGSVSSGAVAASESGRQVPANPMSLSDLSNNDERAGGSSLESQSGSQPGSRSHASGPPSLLGVSTSDAFASSGTAPSGLQASQQLTASHQEVQRASLAGKVALFLGFSTLLFAWIPCLGVAMLPFSCIGLGLAIFSIVMSWGIPETRVRFQVAAAIICSVSITASAVSGYLFFNN